MDEHDPEPQSDIAHTYEEAIAAEIVSASPRNLLRRIRDAPHQIGETEKGNRRMKYGLPQSTVQKICSVLNRYPQVEKAILYGSRAKGNYKNGSDIDLTLRGGADLTLNVIYKILYDLDELAPAIHH